MKFRIFPKNNTLGLTRNICQKLEDYILEIQIYVTYTIFRVYKSIRIGRVENVVLKIKRAGISKHFLKFNTHSHLF